jgi:Uma2 family endonuclease
MLTEEKRTYSPAEYLAMEVNAEERHAYIDGETVPMPGGLPNHNQITLNLAGTLNFALKRQPYCVFALDQRLWIPQRRTYTYPDVMVVAADLEYAEGRRDTITNPCLIAEILSESTQNYDRNQKFAAYRNIPTFREYLLISQSEPYVELYSKAENKQWIYTAYEAADENVSLSCLPFSILLLDLYDKVNFASAS